MKLIGIAGRANSGKSQAASFLVKNSGFASIALADPIKKIARDLFVFSDEQLFGPSSARNAPDKRFKRKHGPWIDSDAYGDNAQCACCGINWTTPNYEAVPCYLTPRLVLQLIGTEVGRTLYPNVWVDKAVATAKTLLDPTGPNFFRYDRLYGPVVDAQATGPDGAVVGDEPAIGPVAGVCISDVRFKNEIDAIHDAGGKVIRMLRGSGLEGAAGQHVSETEMSNISDECFDRLVDNRTWSLDQLEERMRELVAQVPGKREPLWGVE